MWKQTGKARVGGHVRQRHVRFEPNPAGKTVNDMVTALVALGIDEGIKGTKQNTKIKGAVARNETCSSLIFMQKDNPGIFKPRD
jgi:hypothetical protein